MGAVQALADVTMKALQREVPQLDNLTRLMLTAFDFGAFLTSQHGLVQAFNRHSQPGQGVTLAKAMPLEEGMSSPEDQGEDAGTLLHESQFDLAATDFWLTAGSSARHQRKRRCAESSIIPVIDVEAL